MQSVSECLHGDIKALTMPYVTPVVFPYLAPSELYRFEKPYLSRLPYAAELKRTNIITESHPVRIFSVSGNEEYFILDECGFQFAKSPIQLQQWDERSVRSEYIPRMTDWLKSYLNCQRIFIYAYNVSCIL